mmetsp:Transcript_28299/g.84719  ORF Transcript_28299/g.84719 Transcript_28299/m.84719 type:complete len:118 (+) Transcript_28299:392-745(+)
MVTVECILSEAKLETQEMVTSYLNVVAGTNEEFPFPVEVWDRRFFVPDMNDTVRTRHPTRRWRLRSKEGSKGLETVAKFSSIMLISLALTPRRSLSQKPEGALADMTRRCSIQLRPR